MSPVALSLDLLLMVLLMAALVFGWRLDQRLKSLKASQADFTGAIADLDRAAQRAETGLAQLRQATDEAVDLLAGRIEKARELTSKLERLTQEAAAIRPRAANDAVRPAPAPQRTAAAPSDAVRAAEALARRLSGEAGPIPRQTTAAAAARRPQPARQPIPPSRLSIDDELFEAPLRVAAAGRR